MEITRLVIGLMIAFFHRPIADFVVQQETSLIVLFRQRGLMFPSLPRTELVRNVYFATGILIALFEIGRIWYLLQ
jgi:hypothetical protein